MTRLCVPIFVTEPAEARRAVALAAEAGAEMAELRIDKAAPADGLLDKPPHEALLADATLPTIVTCRPTWEGGHSQLPDDSRVEMLLKAAKAGASYVDVEFASFRGAEIDTPPRNDVLDFVASPRDTRPGLILSSHDFSGRPARLALLVEDLWQSPADVAKVVWTARTIRDNLEAFEILLIRQKPTIALCMGEHGLISRILAKKFGGFLTFASLTQNSGTALGQVTITDMKRLYRWDALDRDTQVYGVVASPVMHSMSPAIHNAAFEHIGHNGVYLPLLVNEGYESFKAFMESFLAFAPLHLSGLSVTLPHKENALRYLTEVDAAVEPLARDIGAVNTIAIHPFPDGPPALRGFNTDYAAILDCITDKLGITREQLAKYRVAVLGAGGTGRTAVAALAHYGATVVIYNRTIERAEALAAEFNGRSGKVVAAPLERLCKNCCQIYVNTTSVGMHPNVDVSPFGDELPAMTADTLVFDAIYNPMKTKLLRQAEEAGAKTVGGVEMFLRQAVGQFEAWTGKPAPVDVMRAVIEQRLGAVRA